MKPSLGAQRHSCISHKEFVMQRQDTHSKLIGYLLWIFGFLGSHRFYYGKPVTGTIWFSPWDCSSSVGSSTCF